MRGITRTKREKIAGLLKEGKMSQREIADKLDVSVSTVNKVKSELDERAAHALACFAPEPSQVLEDQMYAMLAEMWADKTPCEEIPVTGPGLSMHWRVSNHAHLTGRLELYMAAQEDGSLRGAIRRAVKAGWLAPVDHGRGAPHNYWIAGAGASDMAKDRNV
jgi:transposase